MSAHERYAAAEARHIARFRSKFHMQRTEFEAVAKKQASASLNVKTLETANNMKYEVSAAAKRLTALRHEYRREMRQVGQSIARTAGKPLIAPRTSSSSNNASSLLFEAKSIIQKLPKFILDDDPELKSTLKIVRSCSAFGFNPKKEKALGEIIDLVKRSAYAIDAPRAIQFISSLQNFNPRPDDDIRAILDNVADGIRMGSNDLLVHEVTTLLAAILKLEQAELQQLAKSQRKKRSSEDSLPSPSSSSSSPANTYQRKILLDALTRHLVTYHSTAPINDVSKAAAFLTKISSAHGRVFLHEIQPRVAKEVNNLSIPPLAALDLMTGYGCVEAEDANPVVHFPKNYDLDADVAAPPSLFLSSRPIYKTEMLAMASETIITHVEMLNGEDIAECFNSLKENSHHFKNEVLVDRLISRAMQAADKTGMIAICKILEAVNYFIVKPKQSANLLKKASEEEDPQLEGAMMLFDRYSTRIVKSFNSFSVASVAALLTVYAEGNQKSLIHNEGNENITKLMQFLMESLFKSRKNFNSIGDALLIKILEMSTQLELYSDVNGETALKKATVKVIGMIVHEIFVERGGLPDDAGNLIHVTEDCVNKMLPQVEKDAALLNAIKPLIEG